jgi:hypothetical protein
MSSFKGYKEFLQSVLVALRKITLLSPRKIKPIYNQVLELSVGNLFRYLLLSVGQSPFLEPLMARKPLAENLEKFRHW